MTDTNKTNAAVAHYQLEIEISADPDRVWEAMVTEIDAWWLPDFHMVGPGSTLHFEPHAGGGLIEESPDGASLLWYTVHWIRPAERTVYLVGHIAPDWGGPACSHLKFAVEPRGGGSVLLVTDTHFGHVDEQNLATLKEGWSALFRDGLKAFIERGVRQN